MARTANETDSQLFPDSPCLDACSRCLDGALMMSCAISLTFCSHSDHSDRIFYLIRDEGRGIASQRIAVQRDTRARETSTGKVLCTRTYEKNLFTRYSRVPVLLSTSTRYSYEVRYCIPQIQTASPIPNTASTNCPIEAFKAYEVANMTAAAAASKVTRI